MLLRSIYIYVCVQENRTSQMDVPRLYPVGAADAGFLNIRHAGFSVAERDSFSDIN